MMLHSVNATYAPKKTGRMLKTRKGTAKKATKRYPTPSNFRPVAEPRMTVAGAATVA